MPPVTGGDGVRADIPYATSQPKWTEMIDGHVACDPGERLVNPDAYDDPGSLVLTIALPVHRAEALSDALELLDESAKLWQSTEHVPSGWKDLRQAIITVTAELERRGLIPE